MVEEVEAHHQVALVVQVGQEHHLQAGMVGVEFLHASKEEAESGLREVEEEVVHHLEEVVEEEQGRHEGVEVVEVEGHHVLKEGEGEAVEHFALEGAAASVSHGV